MTCQPHGSSGSEVLLFTCARPQHGGQEHGAALHGGGGAAGRVRLLRARGGRGGAVHGRVHAAHVQRGCAAGGALLVRGGNGGDAVRLEAPP